MNKWHTAALVAISALVIFTTRALPFIVFKDTAVVPRWLGFLGKALPGAVISVLVIYCLRSVSFESVAGFAPVLISVAVVAVLHWWKRNNLLSIGGGTVLYMLLVQLVF